MSSLLSFLWLVSIIMHGRFVNRCVVQQCILIFLWKFIRHGKTVGCFLFTCLMSGCKMIIYSTYQRTVKSWSYDIGLWYNSKWKGPKKVSSLQQDQHWAQTSFSQGFVKLGLKDSNDGAYTASLGSLFCCLAVLIENFFLPRSSLKLCFFNLHPLSLIYLTTMQRTWLCFLWFSLRFQGLLSGPPQSHPSSWLN